MARNRNRDWIGGTGLRDCPDRFWCTNPLSDFGVAHRGTDGDFPKRLPHPKLKSGSSHVQRQIEPHSWRLNESDHLGNHLFEFALSANKFGARELILETTNQRCRVITQRNGANALL